MYKERARAEKASATTRRYVWVDETPNGKDTRLDAGGERISVCWQLLHEELAVRVSSLCCDVCSNGWITSKSTGAVVSKRGRV